jgi:hypothetical protein
METQYSLERAAQIALQCQNACNLSGVVRSFALITKTLWVEARAFGHGTQWVNSHPISVMFSSKIASLCGSENSDILSAAIDSCMEYGNCDSDGNTLAVSNG